MHVEHSVTTVQRVGSAEITCTCTSKADKMRGFQYILLCALLNSIMVNAFYSCESATDDDSCPDNSACVDVDGGTRFECQCDEGFDVVDLPGLTINGQAATVCIDFGYCSPFDNKVDDCINGQCVVYPDQYGSYQSTCKCKDGFYGEKCDETMPQASATSGTTKKSGSEVLTAIIGGGAILLQLVGGAVALASLTE